MTEIIIPIVLILLAAYAGFKVGYDTGKIETEKIWKPKDAINATDRIDKT